MNIVQLLKNPSLYIIEDFLSDAECDWFVEKGKPNIKESTVINVETGESVKTDYRVSSTYFFPRYTEKTVQDVEDRIVQITNLPVANGEQLQLVYYPQGGYYKPHYDYYDPAHPGNRKILESKGQRHATVLIYLNTIEKGGNTSFPNIGLEIQARKGRAIVWYNCLSDGKIDSSTMHASEPVIEGEKWSLTKWLHSSEFK